MSVLQDGTGFRSHGMTRSNIKSFPFPVWNQKTKLIAYFSVKTSNPRIFVHGWDSAMLVASPILDINSGMPSFSPNGKQIAFGQIEGRISTSISIVDTNGANLKNISLNGEAKQLILLQFSYDGRSIIYIGSENGSSWALYEVNINGPSYHEKICDVEALPKTTFLISPVAHQSLWFNQETGSKPTLVLTDFTDMDNVTSEKFEIDDTSFIFLLSFSSNGKSVYLLRSGFGNSIIELEIESKKVTEIFRIPLE